MFSARITFRLDAASTQSVEKEQPSRLASSVQPFARSRPRNVTV
jgi:hypothetical protein